MCESGQIKLYFVNYSEKVLRTEFIFCPICEPDGKARNGAGVDEEEISVTDYYKYFEDDWREINPV
jgi:hypothetical protein